MILERSCSILDLYVKKLKFVDFSFHEVNSAVREDHGQAWEKTAFEEGVKVKTYLRWLRRGQGDSSFSFSLLCVD